MYEKMPPQAYAHISWLIFLILVAKLNRKCQNGSNGEMKHHPPHVTTNEPSTASFTVPAYNEDNLPIIAAL